MNWEGIKKNHPESIKLLAKYFNCYKHSLNLWVNSDDKFRRLYDFFDNNEIQIFIIPDFKYEILYNLEEDALRPGEYFFSMLDKAEKYYDTRSNAEIAAFTKAFELLEAKLQEGK